MKLQSLRLRVNVPSSGNPTICAVLTDAAKSTCPSCCCPAQIPFVKRAPLVTFRKPIGSVSVSGHKFIGAPVPCGVVITRQRYVEALSKCAMACGACKLQAHFASALRPCCN